MLHPMNYCFVLGKDKNYYLHKDIRSWNNTYIHLQSLYIMQEDKMCNKKLVTF